MPLTKTQKYTIGAGSVAVGAAIVTIIGVSGKPVWVPAQGTMTLCAAGHTAYVMHLDAPATPLASGRIRYGPTYGDGNDLDKKCIVEEFEHGWASQWFEWKGFDPFDTTAKEDFGLAMCGGQPCSQVYHAEYCNAHPGACGVVGPKCGDGKCEPPETIASCPSDCKPTPPPPICGDAKCESPETDVSCPADCKPPVECPDCPECPPEPTPCPTLSRYEVDRAQRGCSDPTWANIKVWQRRSLCDQCKTLRDFAGLSLANYPCVAPVP